MGIRCQEVLERLEKYSHEADGLSTALRQRGYGSDPSFPGLPSISTRITDLGKNVKELSKDVFEGSDEEHDPFHNIEQKRIEDPGVFIQAHPLSQIKNFELDSKKINSLENFIQRKIDKIRLWINSGIDEIPDKDIQNKIQQPTFVGHADQANIANTITIQNFQNEIEKLIVQIDKEPNLTDDEKEILKEKVGNWKLAGKELLEYGKTIVPNLVTEGLRGLFG